jgi:hypothetical protein
MKKTMKEALVRVFDVECYLEFDTYSNGKTAIRLIDSSDDEEYTVATVNVPFADLPPGHVAIKSYSENEGVLEALIEAGVVKDTGVKLPSGFISLPVVALTEVYL